MFALASNAFAVQRRRYSHCSQSFAGYFLRYLPHCDYTTTWCTALSSWYFPSKHMAPVTVATTLPSWRGRHVRVHDARWTLRSKSAGGTVAEDLGVGLCAFVNRSILLYLCLQTWLHHVVHPSVTLKKFSESIKSRCQSQEIRKEVGDDAKSHMSTCPLNHICSRMVLSRAGLQEKTQRKLRILLLHPLSTPELSKNMTTRKSSCPLPCSSRKTRLLKSTCQTARNRCSFHNTACRHRELERNTF